LKVIFERLKLACPASSRDEAHALVLEVVNEVEAEETGLPPNFSANSGRMYFYDFSPDLWKDLNSDPARLDLNQKHFIELYHSGRIVIFSRHYDEDTEVFRKDGA
jgi:hypothetical protein